MKIVHVAEAFAGGIPVFIKSLADSMKDDTHIIIHGNRAEVMCADQIKKQFTGSVNVRFIPWRSAQRSIHLYKDVISLLELGTLLRRLKKMHLVDVVHLHSSKGGFLGRLACRLTGINNVIYTPNGAPFLVGKHKVSNYIYKRLEKLGSSLPGQVVCCSVSEQTAYAKAGIRSIRINNGISLQESLPAFPGNSLPVPKRKFRVVCCGRLVSQKNPALFNRIAGYFQDLPWFEFVWIGDGELRHLLTAPNISVTGWTDHNHAKEMLSKGDIYLSTATFEGLSFAVLEALVLNKPVLLTHCPGNRDLVNQNLNGDLFTTEQEAIIKIMQYHNNRPMLKAMGKQSVLHCNDSFNVKNTFAQYHQLYRNRLHPISC